MEEFLSGIPGCEARVIVVEQTQDGSKFNRGQLLNAGFQMTRSAVKSAYQGKPHIGPSGT